MKPHTCTVLNRIDAELSEIIEGYDRALHRLEVEVTPGFPTSTPGNGSPPGGSGGRGTSVAERLMVAGQALFEVEDLGALMALPARLVADVHQLLTATGHVGRRLPPEHLGELSVGKRLAWCRWAVRQVIAGRDELDLDGAGEAAVEQLRRTAGDGRAVVRSWGYVTRRPHTAKPGRAELAHDATESLCRSCLRAGSRSTRYRGELCQWCWRFHQTEGFLPPVEIVTARAAGQRITEAMVAPHRAVHRKRQKQRRRMRRG
jgi:hypothetical protein